MVVEQGKLEQRGIVQPGIGELDTPRPLTKKEFLDGLIKIGKLGAATGLLLSLERSWETIVPPGTTAENAPEGWFSFEGRGDRINLNIRQADFAESELQWLKINSPKILNGLASIIGGEEGEIFIRRGAPNENDTPAWVYCNLHKEILGTLVFRSNFIAGEKDEFGRDSIGIVSHEFSHLTGNPFSKEMAKLFNLDDPHEFITQLGDVVSLNLGGDTIENEPKSSVIYQVLQRDSDILKRLFWEYRLRNRLSLSREEWVEIADQVSPGSIEAIMGRHFPETDFFVKGEFLEAFSEYGGEAILGPPVSREFSCTGEKIIYQCFRNGCLVLDPKTGLRDNRFLPIINMPEREISYHRDTPVRLVPAGWYLYKRRSEGNYPSPDDDDWVKEGDFELDPHFSKFVRQFGGEEIFGMAISPPLSRGNVLEQWTTRFRLVFDGKDVFLAPLGEDLRDEFFQEQKSAFSPLVMR